VPDLLTLLAQPELGLPFVRRGAGPMAVARKGTAAILSLIPPEQRGMPAQDGFARNVRNLVVEFLTPEAAVKRFNDGDVDLVLGGRIDSLPLAGSTALARGNIQLDPVIGMFGLLVETETGFLADAPNREALALAIDRDALITAFNIGGWEATTRVVSAGVEGDAGTVGERWVGVAMEQRRTLASERVARYKLAGHAAPVLRIAMPDGPGSRMVLDRLTRDFGAVGVGVVRVAEDRAADLRLVDATARYGRATWFLDQLACTVHKPGCNAAGDALLAQARVAKDLTQRAALLGEAEAEITAADGFIPIARPLRWSLVRSGVPGFALNPWGWHPLPPLAVIPK
jgi:peptide/nickel transport system substrate-binding protein/oligopeptide transport system substrate-binding protein